MVYAEIDSENICYAISDMGDVEIIDSKLIKLDFFDASIIGKKYNNGIWEDVPQPEPEPEPLSMSEQTILDIAINSEYLVCLADLNL